MASRRMADRDLSAEKRIAVRLDASGRRVDTQTIWHRGLGLQCADSQTRSANKVENARLFDLGEQRRQADSVRYVAGAAEAGNLFGARRKISRRVRRYRHSVSFVRSLEGEAS